MILTNAQRDVLNIAVRHNSELSVVAGEVQVLAELGLLQKLPGINAYAVTDLGRERNAIEQRMAPLGECKYCDELRERGERHFPAHDASHGCKSGRRPHCTCEYCW